MIKSMKVTFPIVLQTRSGYMEVLNEMVKEGHTRNIVVPGDINLRVAKAYCSFLKDLGRECMSLPFVSSRECFAWKEQWARANAFFDGDFPVYPMTEWLIELYATNADMGCLAALDLARRHGEFLTESFELDPYRHLVQVNASHDFVMKELDFDRSRAALVKPTGELVTIRHQSGCKIRIYRQPKHQQIPSAKALYTMCKKSMPLACIKNIPWLAHRAPSGGGVIIAGGAVVSGLYGRPMSKGQDMDVFIIASSASQALDVWHLFYSAVCEHYGVLDVRVMTGPLVTDIYAKYEHRHEPEPEYEMHKFQVIRRVYPSPSHVVHGFDIDICGILFDGDCAYMTQHAWRASTTGVLLYDENKLSTTFDNRIAKYAKRHGLSTLVVGAPQDTVDEAVLEIEAMMTPESESESDSESESTTTISESESTTTYFSSEACACGRRHRKVQNKLALSVTPGSRYSILGLLSHLYIHDNSPDRTSDYVDMFLVPNHVYTKAAVRNVCGSDYTEDMFPLFKIGNGSRKSFTKWMFTGSFNPIECNTLDFMRHL